MPNPEAGLPQCPECEAVIVFQAAVGKGEIVVCADCGVDLEVTRVAPIALALAPKEAEDWGE